MSDQSFVTVDLGCDALGAEVRLLAAAGREAMNALSSWTLDVVAVSGAIAADDAIGAAATITLTDPLEEAPRSIGLIVTEVTFEHMTADGPVYRLTLAPPEWLLTLRSGYRIFQEKSGPDIVKLVLTDAGTAADKIVTRLSGGYGLRLHTTQYGEGDWAFLERICAEEGISYWFDSTDAGPNIVFGDDPGSHDGTTGGPTLPFHDPSGMVHVRSITELAVEERVVTESTTVRDYDVRHPDVLIEGKSGKGSLEHYEYPARVIDGAAATERARVRLEQLGRFRVRATAKSDSIRLQPGRFFTIAGCAEADLDADYVVVEVTHRWSAPSRGRADSGRYQNEAVLVPKEGPAHRPALPHDRPQIPGTETAITTGASGEEIHTNDLGELKIRFPWDRSGIFDDKSSTWVRCLQMGLGGSMLIPRVGWEVPVVYYDGDPDRPLVLGRLYNAEGVVPYGLPAAKATTALQSATSPGGGSTNEIRMGDDAGKMEMFIHASKDQSVFVGGSATTTVTANKTHDVTLSLGLTVTGTQTLTVGASQKVDVTTNYSTGVKGARTESVAAIEMSKVTGNRAVAAKGSYTELVGALYGIQANQANVDVTGIYSQNIGAVLAHGAGLGTSESVGGARMETVGAMKSITASKEYGEDVKGAKLVNAGSCKIDAGTVVTTTTKGAMNIQVGGATKIDSSGVSVFGANQIEIKAASLKAGALKLVGGAFKVGKGKAKLDGTIKRKGGSKVG